MKRKKILKFLRKNYFFVIIILCIAFVGTVLVARTLYAKPNYVYVKVKVGQGLWWASAAKPSIWYVNSINEGDAVRDLFGNKTAEILGKRYYRWYTGDLYDIYIVIKLKAKLNKKTGQYSFQRNNLSINSPIDFQFPKSDISGTIIELSEKPIMENKYIEKTIYLSKRGAFPWELEAIHIGEGYYDGEEEIFRILEKSGIEISNLTFDSYGNSNTSLIEASKYITVKAKIKLKNINGQWILGEDQIVTPGRNINMSTPGFVFDNYIVSKIE